MKSNLRFDIKSTCVSTCYARIQSSNRMPLIVSTIYLRTKPCILCYIQYNTSIFKSIYITRNENIFFGKSKLYIYHKIWFIFQILSFIMKYKDIKRNNTKNLYVIMSHTGNIMHSSFLDGISCTTLALIGSQMNPR